jgi:DNA-binding GntR family transcriptional regulator
MIINNIIDIWLPLAEKAPGMAAKTRTKLDEATAATTRGQAMEHVVAAIIVQLEEDIVLGFVHLRERLVEDALMERFAAKRYAVREALARLARLGLVERLPNRGALVRALTPDEVDEIYFVRELLEAAAAREVVRRASPALIAGLKQIQRRHDRATRDGDPRTAFRANIDFHHAFFAACTNRELVETIEQFAQKAHGVRSIVIAHREYLDRARSEHWAIIEALEKRDHLKLLATCRDHIHVARHAYIDSYRRRFPAPPAGAAPNPVRATIVSASKRK